MLVFTVVLCIIHGLKELKVCLRMLERLYSVLVLVTGDHTQTIATKPLVELDFPILWSVAGKTC